MLPSAGASNRVCPSRRLMLREGKEEYMKINYFESGLPQFAPLSFEEDKPLCFVECGSMLLNLLRALADGGEGGVLTAPLEAEAPLFSSRLKVELAGAEYLLMGSLWGEDDFTVSVEREGVCDLKEAVGILSSLRCLKSDKRNCFDGTAVKAEGRITPLGQSDLLLEAFECFYEGLRQESARGDRRPVYVYAFFDRLDRGVDVDPLLCRLAALDRQVFVSVCRGYPAEKLGHPSVQIVKEKFL